MTGQPTPTDEAWLLMLAFLRDYGAEIAPRGLRTRELIGYQTKVPMTLPVVTLAARKLGYRFLAAESAWILSGDNRVETIAPYSKEISRFSNNGLTFRGAYGPKFVDQVDYVVDALRQDAGTRQAVINLWRERPGPSKDHPCTLSLQWLLRRRELHCVATMRSSDCWLGWPYDVHTFSMMSAVVLLTARAVGGPRSGWNEVGLGGLYLTCGSQHLYEPNWEAADAALKDRTVAVELAPLDVDQFSRPRDLVDHLWAIARRDELYFLGSNGHWLAETLNLRKEPAA